MWRNLGMLMVLCFFPIFLISGHARSQKPVVMVDFLKDCVAVRVVGAQRSDTRGQHLIVLMETLEKEPREIRVHFQNHSLSVHEATLQALVGSFLEPANKENPFARRKIREDVEVELLVPDPKRPEGTIHGKVPPTGVNNSEWLEKCALKAVRFKKDKETGAGK